MATLASSLLFIQSLRGEVGRDALNPNKHVGALIAHAVVNPLRVDDGLIASFEETLVFLLFIQSLCGEALKLNKHNEALIAHAVANVNLLRSDQDLCLFLCHSERDNERKRVHLIATHCLPRFSLSLRLTWSRA